jgi:hypothetical protein
MQILAYLLARFSEPSSYAGLGALLALLGWNLPNTTLGQIVQVLAGGCGLLALLLKERGLIGVFLLIFAVVPALTACTALQAADATITTACGEYTKGKTAATAIVASGFLPSAVAAKVASIESFGDAACADPPAGDPLSTAIWLGQLVGQITTLADGG